MHQSQIIKKIQDLKLKEAKNDIKALKDKGENVISLEHKFNKALSKNKNAIEKKFILVINDLLKKGELLEIHKIQKKLIQIGLKSKSIDNLIEKANKQLLKKTLNQHQEDLSEFRRQMKIDLEKNEYNNLMKRTYDFIKKNKWTKDNHYDLQLIKEVKRKIIDDKYKDNKKKLKKHTILTQFEFIKKLYLIEENYPFAQKLLYKYQQKLAKYDKLKKKIITREALINLKVIFNQKKFETAISKAHEFLKTQPNNKSVIKFIKKARTKIQSQNYKIAFDKIVKNQKQSL